MSGPRPLNTEEAEVTRRMAAGGSTAHAVVLALRARGLRRSEKVIQTSRAYANGRTAWLASEKRAQALAAAGHACALPKPHVVRWLHPHTHAEVSLPKLAFQPTGWEKNAAEWWAS